MHSYLDIISIEHHYLDNLVENLDKHSIECQYLLHFHMFEHKLMLQELELLD